MSWEIINRLARLEERVTELEQFIKRAKEPTYSAEEVRREILTLPKKKAVKQ